MQDVFARIGLAMQHLLNQSTVNGPARDEVERLANELQTLEENIGGIVESRIQAALEGAEGRLRAYVDLQFSLLADSLEAAGVKGYQPPVLAEQVVYADPAPVPADEPTAYIPTTGNIPATPIEVAPVLGGGTVGAALVDDPNTAALVIQQPEDVTTPATASSEPAPESPAPAEASPDPSAGSAPSADGSSDTPPADPEAPLTIPASADEAMVEPATEQPSSEGAAQE